MTSGAEPKVDWLLAGSLLMILMVVWLSLFRFERLSDRVSDLEALHAQDTVEMRSEPILAPVDGTETRALVLRIALEEFEGHVPPQLALAVMAVESWGDSVAISRAGAVGLMQIMPNYHLSLILRTCGSLDALVERECNIRVGLRILKMYKEQHGDWSTALKAYNGALSYPRAGQRYLRAVERHLGGSIDEL